MSSSVSPKEFFKFCPTCAAPYTENSVFEEHHLNCQNCGFVFYQNPKPAVGAAVLNEQNQILLVRRAIEPGKGTWDIPGGFIEWGEDTEAAIIREIQEELHISFIPEKILLAVHSWYDYAGIDNSALNIVYLGRYSGGDIQPDSDVDAYAWFDIDAPPDQLSFPEMIRIFEQLKNEAK